MAKRVGPTEDSAKAPTLAGDDPRVGQTVLQGKGAERSARAHAVPLPGALPPPDKAPASPLQRVASDDSFAETVDSQPYSSSDSDASSGILNAAYGSSIDSSSRPTSSAPGQFPVAEWDRYEFLCLIGRGGMGSVYKAKDKRIHRLVALKFVRGDDDKLLRRFLQEARSQARIDHPNICKVLEVGEVENKPYIAMQYIEGESLQHAKKDLSLEQKVLLTKETAEALHAAHQAGIVHRDIKPANIMVEKRTDGEWHPVVMDFGIARDNNDTGITESGTVLGTAAYMSPEQARGEVKRLDRRTDIYSLGATLFDLLAGRPPFVAKSTADMLMLVMMEDPPSLRKLNPNIPDALDTIVNKCLAKEPEERYGTARELAEDLGRYVAKDSILGSKVSFTARLRWKARHNKPLAATTVAFFSALVLLVAGGTRNFVLNRRLKQEAAGQAQRLKERAEKRAQLSQRLGQEITKMEWLLRSARQLPLHDLEHEKGIIRKQMERLKGDLLKQGDEASGLIHYALGRGHLALHEYPEALAELQAAQKEGQDDAELHYALGVVMGKHYEEAMHKARLSGGGAWAIKQLKEIAPKYLKPALDSLARARVRETDTPDFLEALILHYQGKEEESLAQLRRVKAQAPWLYETDKLQGDIHHERALHGRDGGQYAEAEKEFSLAVAAYEAAAQVGRSDAEVYEGLAETWVRQVEMATFRGQPADKPHSQAVAAANLLSAADSSSVEGNMKRGFATMLAMGFSGTGGQHSQRISECLSEADAVLRKRPEDPYALEMQAACMRINGDYLAIRGENPIPRYIAAIAVLQPAVQKNPNFLWGLSDLSVLWTSVGIQHALSGSPLALDSLDRASGYLAHAATLDETYLVAFQNLLWTEVFRISQLPDKAALSRSLAHADEVFSWCMRQNSSYQQCHLNVGEVYAQAAKWGLDHGDERTEFYVEKAHKALAVARRLGDKFLDLEQFTAQTFWVEAAWSVKHNRNPQKQLEEMRKAVSRCFALGSTDAMCRTLAARGSFVEADWLKQTGKAGFSALREGLRLAVLATQSPEVYPDAWATLGASHLHLARHTTGQERKQHIQGGQAALAKAFAVNPKHAEARETEAKLQELP